MLLWFLFAAMTGIAVLTVLVPLGRARAAGAAMAADAAIYRDQLDEIERDLARGLIAPAEADAARAEVSRRLIAAAERDGAAGPAGGATRRRRIVAVLALVLVPGLALGGYLAVGSPDLPGRPLVARLLQPQTEQDMALVVRRIEARLAARPDDGRGWDVLAPVYLDARRYADAARAFGEAIRLLGAAPERLAGRGEAFALAADGRITPEARADFAAAIAADPGNARARFYLARAAEQDGDAAEARRRLEALLAEAGADVPWLGVVRMELARLAAGGSTPQ